MHKHKVAIGADHGGFELKQQLASHLRAGGYEVVDCGVREKVTADYPRIAQAVALRVAAGQCGRGIIIDGAGIGSAMAANKVKGVRAAACYSEALANNCREHNGANVLTLGAGQTDADTARRIVDVFLTTECSAQRHLRRVGLIDQIDSHRLTPTNKTEEDVDLSAQDIEKIALRVKDILIGGGVAGTGAAGALGERELAGMIDHTCLKPEATRADIRKLCEEAIEHGFFSVCVNASFAKYAKDLLRGSPVKLCCVVGFPLGAMTPQIKAMETRQAIRDGANEIDMVINVGALKEGECDLVERDIRAVVEACKERSILCKVILETCLLTDEEKVKACELSMKARADFVKTSTGFSKGGATAEDIALMARTVAPKKLGVKASGGVRSYEDALCMIRAGATRIGASSSVGMIKKQQPQSGGKY